MTQNIYDNDAFFAGYSRLPRSRLGLAGAPEWQALSALLPALAGANVVDLGCGFGWFCRWARGEGAASVLGIDVSEKMLGRAREMTGGDAICYERQDLDALELRHAAFDLAFSSLAFHYLADIGRLFRVLRRAVRPGGALVFSVEHPVFTAPTRPQWLTLPDAGRIWPLDSYAMEGPRTTDWLAPGVVKSHRTLASYLNALIESGFAPMRIVEWTPTDEQLAAAPEWAEERDRPTFLLVSARG